MKVGDTIKLKDYGFGIILYVKENDNIMIALDNGEIVTVANFV